MAKRQEEDKAQEGKKAKKERITKDMLIGDITSKYPETAKIMFNYGLHCVGCGMVAFETLEQGCKAHGMSDKQVDKLVKEMNRVVKKNKNKQ